MRRAFDESEFLAPPLLQRRELQALIYAASNLESHEKLTFVAAPKGFGVTRTFEEVAKGIKNKMRSQYCPPLVMVSDLSLVGRCIPVQILVALRNSFLRSVDESLGVTRAELNFLVFDFVAYIAWRRDRPELKRMDPPLYRTRFVRRANAVGRLAKSLLLLESADAIGDLVDADKYIEWALGETGEEALKSFVSKYVIGVLHTGFGDELLEEIKKGRQGRRDGLDIFLALLLFHAIKETASNNNYNKLNNISNKSTNNFSPMKNKLVNEVLLIVDAADNFDYEANSLFGKRVVGTISALIREFCASIFGSVFVGGQTRESSDPSRTLPQWREKIGGEYSGHYFYLSPFRRDFVLKELERTLGASNPTAAKIVSAISEEGTNATIHPSAYAEAFRYCHALPDTLESIRAAQRVIWAAGSGPFTHVQLFGVGNRILPADDAQRTVDLIWKSDLWTRPDGNGSRSLTWQMSASIGLVDAA